MNSVMPTEDQFGISGFRYAGPCKPRSCRYHTGTVAVVS